MKKSQAARKIADSDKTVDQEGHVKKAENNERTLTTPRQLLLKTEHMNCSQSTHKLYNT